MVNSEKISLKTSKTVVEVPLATYDQMEKVILEDVPEMKKALADLGREKSPPKVYTKKEFRDLAKIGANKMEEILPYLNAVRVSPRKILIPHSDLLRWFRGEIH